MPVRRNQWVEAGQMTCANLKRQHGAMYLRSFSLCSEDMPSSLHASYILQVSVCRLSFVLVTLVLEPLVRQASPMLLHSDTVRSSFCNCRITKHFTYSSAVMIFSLSLVPKYTLPVTELHVVISERKIKKMFILMIQEFWHGFVNFHPE